MGALFIFIFISVLVISTLLFFNKGDKAQEIKSILKDIFENFKELFSNLKKLFLIVKGLILERLDNEPIQLKDESSFNTPPKSNNANESSSLSSTEIDSFSDNSNTETPDSKTDLKAVQEFSPSVEPEPPSDESSNDKTISRTGSIVDQKMPLSIEVEPPSNESGTEKNNS